MSCREQHVKVARTAVVGRDSAVGNGSSLDEGTQVRFTALHAWMRTRKPFASSRTWQPWDVLHRLGS